MGKIVNGIEWDGNGHSWLRHGTRQGEVIATIRKLKNHTATNDENWEVAINGITFGQRFRHVRDAQEFAASKAEIQ